MAAKKATKTKKQVTEIDDAKVKIEVDEIDEKETEEKSEEKSEDTETASTVNESDKEPIEEISEEEEIIEDFDEGGRFSWKKVFLFTIVAAFIGLIIVGVYLVFVAGDYKISIEKVDKNQPDKAIDIPEVTPTPTEAPTGKNDYEITVLNGSGIEGEAAAVQELLEDDDFVVDEIGNADNAAYLDTQILAGEDVDEDYLDMLQEALEVRGPVEVEEAPEDQTEDVVVIVGSELADPDATPTPILE